MALAEILGLPSCFKFEPTDTELVELFLLRRLRGQRLPFYGVVIDDDPRSAPPWKLLASNGRNNEDSAYFFAPAGNNRQNQAVRGCVGGGTWVGQKLEAREELRAGDEEMVVWQKYRLNFHWGSGRSGSTGWVMLEYTVVVPDRASFKICHVAFTGHGQKRKRVPDDYVDSDIATAAPQLAPPPAPWYQDSGEANTCQQEHFLEQYSYACNQAYNVNDAAVHGETEPWAYQEPFATNQFADQRQAPLVDLGAMDHSGQKRKRVPDDYVDSDIAAAAPQLAPPPAPWYQDSGEANTCQQEHFLEQYSYACNQAYNVNDAAVHGETEPWAYQEPFATNQFADQRQAPLVDLGAMDHSMMPLPKQFVEYGMRSLPMDQEPGMPEQDDPLLQAVLESLGDFAIAAQDDAEFGDYWAHAGQGYGETTVV